MRIFWIQTASQINDVLKNKKYKELSYEEIIQELFFFGFTSLFGLHRTYLFTDSDELSIFTNCTNSYEIQAKWAKENGINLTPNWQKDILAAQIEEFKPDVIYTGNYNILDRRMKKYLPNAKLYALWNASPMPDDINLDYFDLGVTFNEVYVAQLKDKGINNVERSSFYINPDIKLRQNDKNLKKNIDISFVGRYTPMFSKRNDMLKMVYQYFIRNHTVNYYLLTTKRIKGLIPIVPLQILRAYKKPVYLENMFDVFSRTKININAHSDITGTNKGNMRVFELLGNGSFMISDDGNYPKPLEKGVDFVVYKSYEDLLNKIDYYLNNEAEREQIAINGYEKIKTNFDTKTGSHNLKSIFEKYL